jgi:hypothetical protein
VRFPSISHLFRLLHRLYRHSELTLLSSSRRLIFCLRPWSSSPITPPSLSLPSTSLHSSHATRIAYCCVIPTEVVAASIVLDYWSGARDVNIAVWITVFIVVVVSINFFGVGTFGEVRLALPLPVLPPFLLSPRFLLFPPPSLSLFLTLSLPTILTVRHLRANSGSPPSKSSPSSASSSPP